MNYLMRALSTEDSFLNQQVSLDSAGIGRESSRELGRGGWGFLEKEGPAVGFLR